MRDEGDRISCEFERAHTAALGPVPEVETLAEFLDVLCRLHGARVLLIDGPQAWKDEANGLVHQRVCEKELATPGKTGVPERVLPRSWTYFAVFSIALFDALARRGRPRFVAADPRAPGALESFPTACWRALGAKPLPGKAKTRTGDIHSRADLLNAQLGVSFAATPSHDELQAAVAGLAGIALEGHPALGWRAHGVAPFQRDGSWREGVIVVAEPEESSR